MMSASMFHVDALTSRTARLWRCRPWHVSPLMRRPDRRSAAQESAAVVNGIGTAVVILVSAGLAAVGMTYAVGLLVARRQSVDWGRHLLELNR